MTTAGAHSAIKRTGSAQFPPPFFERKIQTNVKSFTLTAKLNAICEKLNLFTLRMDSK